MDEQAVRGGAVGSGGRVTVIVGFVLHALVFPVFLTSGLVVPAPAVVGLLALWVAALVFAISRRTQPAVVLATPFASLALLVAVVILGEALLGWTA